MVVAVVAATVTSVMVRKASGSEAKAKKALIGTLVAIGFTLALWGQERSTFGGTFVIDSVALTFKLLFLGTLVAATAYQCAVAVRDLEPAGVVAPPRLLAHGLAALIDTVGAVAAQQQSAQQQSALSLMAITPQVRVGTGACDGNWRTAGMEAPEGPAIICDAGLLLDIASGRTSAPAAYTRGDLRAQDLSGLLDVAQVLARSPGLPGTDGLRAALQAYDSSAAMARAVSGAVGSAWRRLRGS
jgi:hypothetical protein